jgi:hypothetical protein
MLKISLLHATYFSDCTPLAHRDRWLAEAAEPSHVDYVVAMNEEDSRAIETTKSITRAVSAPQDHYSTAVQNWNAAAELAVGDLLFVISDDLNPPHGWDAALRALVDRHNPVTETFAVKVQDSPNPADTTLRHPLISRAFYNDFGLFDPEFRGVFCDNDITIRAYLFSRTVDGRSVEFTHAHPHFDQTVAESISQTKINAPAEYDLGRKVFRKKFSPIHAGLRLNRLRLPTPALHHWLDRSFRRILLAVLKPATRGGSVINPRPTI